MAGDPTQLQVWLVRAAAALAALPLGTLLVAILVEGEASAGEALLAVAAVAAAVALAAAPLACRRRGPFRAAAAAGALLYLAAGTVLLIVGGAVLWPTGLLLAVAAAVPPGWSPRRLLVVCVIAGAALFLVPLGLYGAYTCVRPVPTLVVTFANVRDANEFAASRPGEPYVSFEAESGDGRTYLMRYRRGEGAARDATARRLRREGHVVRRGADRCD